MNRSANGDGVSVGEVVNRLRLLGSTVADLPEKERRAYLAEEVQRAMAHKSRADKTQFLKELSEYFPAFGEVVYLGQHCDKCQEWERKVKDPAFLAAQLGLLYTSAPDNEARRRMRDALKDAGLPLETNLPDAVMRNLLAALGITAPATVNGSHLPNLLVLLGQLVELVTVLDDQVFEAWRILATSNPGPRGPLPRQTIAKTVLAADNSPEQKRAAGDFQLLRDQLRKRLMVLLAALKVVPNQYSKLFAPEDIEAMVPAGGMFRNREREFWNQYVNLCGGREASALQSRVEQMIAEIINKL